MRNKIVIVIAAVVCPEQQIAFAQQAAPILQILIVCAVKFVFQIGYKAGADGSVIQGDVFGKFDVVVHGRRGIERVHIRVDSKADSPTDPLFFNPFFQHRRKAFRRFND